MVVLEPLPSSLYPKYTVFFPHVSKSFVNSINGNVTITKVS